MFRFSSQGASLDDLLQREWLCTNGVGGFASSTLACMNTRKYHGLLVAAMAPPVRRMVLLSRVEEVVTMDGWSTSLACNEYPGTVHPEGYRMLAAFRADPYPSWAYQADGWTIEKGLRLIEGENTVLLTYTMLGGSKPVTLEVRPLLAMRPIHELMYQWNGRLVTEHKSKRHYRVAPTMRTPEVFFAHDGAYTDQAYWYLNTIYRREQDRGYSGLEDLWSPGAVKWTIGPGQTAHFVCSAEPIDLERVLRKAEQQVSASSVVIPAPAGSVHEDLDLLRRAGRQFVAVGGGDTSPERPPMVLDYPWAAPNLRNALIAMPGLMLVTGRVNEARALLRWLTTRLDRGVMPSELPETGGQPLYRGADVSLWFINAVQHYIRWTSDEEFVHRHLFEPMLQIIQHYRHGAPLGICTDADGLLLSRQPGIGTTWMDARHQDWVVTPRGGRPVELNALWYNALRIVADLSERFGQAAFAEELLQLAARMQRAFNERFWNDHERCLFDVVDDHGNDASVRPNQIFAISLPYPVLAPERAADVLAAIERHLQTPMGLRTLSPHDPAYQGRYMGNVIARDRAYHNGSVYPWLLGPFITATLKVRGRGEQARAEMRQRLEPLIHHMKSLGAGQLPELFDGDAPHRPGGAIASARSVGELLRVYVEDILDQAPAMRPPGSSTLADIITPARPVPTK